MIDNLVFAFVYQLHLLLMRLVTCYLLQPFFQPHLLLTAELFVASDCRQISLVNLLPKNKRKMKVEADCSTIIRDYICSRLVPFVCTARSNARSNCLKMVKLSTYFPTSFTRLEASTLGQLILIKCEKKYKKNARIVNFIHCTFCWDGEDICVSYGIAHEKV